jgi:hypothetical protein
MAKRQPPRTRSRRASSGQAEEQAPSDGRPIRFVKQTGAVIAVVSAAVGLFFLVFPQLKPERKSPAAKQSATVGDIALTPKTTFGNFLDFADRSKEGFTREQLAVPVAAAFARIEIVGYRGKSLTIERQVIDAKRGNVVGTTRDFAVTPTAETVQHRWSDWVPLRPGTGSYVMVIKVLDENEVSAIDCNQSEPFGGLEGKDDATPPQLC